MNTAAVVLHVFAAASLTEAFRDLAAVYEKAHPGVVVELSFAGSQVLRTQIEQGAPADVFASADMVHAEALVDAGLLSTVQVFARNKLVVIAPAGPAKVSRLEDLAKPGTKVVLAGATVPVGRYTAQALEKLARRLGEDFKARVEANVVSQETSVRGVLAKVALGEADAGFVYATDAASSRRVRTIALPDAVNVVAEYPIAILKRSPVSPQARSFVGLVLGAEGQAILRKHGFATGRE
jgi:molybdate transport system substrate-binding protein